MSARGCCQHRLRGRRAAGQAGRLLPNLPQPQENQLSKVSEFRILPRIPKSCWLILQNHSEPDLNLPCLLPPAAPVHLISYQDY